MTEEQKADLLRIYGEIELVQHDDTVSDISAIISFAADVYAVVLPIDLIAELKKNTSAEVIQPVSGREKTDRSMINNATGKAETEYIYKHLYWQRINKCEIETERL